MDLSIPLVAIVGLIGYNMNTNLDANSRKYIEKRKKVSENEKPSSENIYESKQYYKVLKDETQRARKINARLSQVNPLPDKKKVQFENFTPSTTKTFTKKTKSPDDIYTGPLFNVNKSQGSAKYPFTKEAFDSGDGISKLSGTKTDFSHQNMVPFFGAKIKGGGSTAGILDRHTGKDKPVKRELESTQNGPQNIYGAQAFTTLVNQDRFNTSKYEANIIPIAQHRVAPIPSDYVRPQYKDVDELRVANNPKESLPGRMNPGVGIGKSSELPTLKHINRPRTWEGRETLPTTNLDKLKPGNIQNNYETFRDTDKKRSTEAPYNTGVAFELGKSTYINYTGKADGSGVAVSDTKRESFANDWVRNNRQEVPLNRINRTDNIHARRQERETYGSEMMGIASYKTKGERINTSDKPRTTNKQLNVYSYTGSANSQGVHVPESRENYYSTELREKVLPVNYTPGGVAFGAPGVGSGALNSHFSYKERASVNNYSYLPKSNKMFTQEKQNIGTNTGKTYFAAEHDFSDRMI
jgi:hypothetical protein